MELFRQNGFISITLLLDHHLMIDVQPVKFKKSTIWYFLFTFYFFYLFFFCQIISCRCCSDIINKNVKLPFFFLLLLHICECCQNDILFLACLVNKKIVYLGFEGVVDCPTDWLILFYILSWAREFHCAVICSSFCFYFNFFLICCCHFIFLIVCFHTFFLSKKKEEEEEEEEGIFA